MKKKLLSISVITALVAGLTATFGVAAPAYAVQTPSAGDLAAARNTILTQTNAHRANNGLPPLVVNNQINTQAQNCSTTQATNDVMAHCTGFQNNYPAGWSFAAENVAAGQAVNSVVSAWIASPGHNANLLDPRLTDIGIGYNISDSGTRYYTQNFGAYSSTKTVPAWVTAPQAVAQPNGTVAVTFNAPVTNGNSAITSYTIRATSQGRPDVTSTVAGTPGTYNLSGLQGGVTYQISVRATNAVGNSAYGPATAVTPVGVPTINVGAIDVTSTTATVNFTANSNGSDITSITIQRGSNNPVTLPTNATSYTFTGLTPGENYEGVIRAVNGVGNSNPAVFALQTLAVAPDAPATSAVVTDKDAIRVDWTLGFDGGADITGYTVTATPQNGSPVVSEVAPSAKTTTFTGLTRGQNYTYTVTAHNAVGSTTSVPASINLPYTQPTVVQDVNAELVAEQTIELSWGTPSDNGGINITGYSINVYANGEYVETISKPAGSNTHMFTPETINPATNYSYTISATNGANLTSNPAGSNTVNVPATPVAPDAVSAISTSNVTSSSFVGQWLQPASNGGAAIESYTYTILDGNNVVDTDTVDATTLIKEFTGLNPYVNYTLQVYATNDRGNSPVASTTVRTLAQAPAKPVLVSSTVLGLDSVEITVGTPSNGGDNNITYDIVVTNNGQIIDEQTGGPTFTINELALGTTYTVDIKATNSAGTSETGTAVFATGDISDPVTNIQVTPSTTNLTVTWDAPANTGTYPLVGYLVEIYEGNSLVQSATVNEENFTASIGETTPLRNGKDYRVVVTPLTHESELPGEKAETTTSIPGRAPFGVNTITPTVNESKATVTWNAPVNNGGAPVTSYNVTLYQATTGNPVGFANVTGTTATFDLPFHSSSYYVRISAANTYGSDVQSVRSSGAFNTGAFKPSTPVIGNVTVNENVATVPVTAQENGGAILRWEYRVNNGQWVTTTVTPLTVTADYGTTNTIEVRAVNSAGTSPVASTNVEIPATNPGKVTNLKATPNADLSADITWNAPVFNGGAEIVETTVTLTNGNDEIVSTATGTSVKVEDLAPYTTYNVKVTVENEAGLTSEETTTFTSSTGTPGAATNGTVNVVGNSSILSVEWNNPTVPATLEGTLRTNVIVRNAETNAIVASVTGLTVTNTTVNVPRNADYTVSLVTYYSVNPTLTNTVGLNTVNVPAIAPTAVTNLNVNFTAGVLTPTFTWTPGNDGGAKQSYEVVVTRDGQFVYDLYTDTASAQGNALQPNVEYDVTVTAVNSAGTSPETTFTFTTATVAPSEPRNVTASVTGTSRTVEFDWDAPTENGGGTVTYEYTVSANGNVVTTNTTSATETTFVGNRGTNYTITVTAVNSAGESESVTSNSVLVKAIASTPVTGLGATADATNNVTVVWGAPTDNGGATITNYRVTLNGETVTVPASTLTYTFNADIVEPNEEYEVSVVAVNSAGNSQAATTQVTTNVVAPSAPTNLALTLDDTLTFSFEGSVSNGGLPVTYSYNVYVNGEVVSTVPNATPGTVYTLTAVPGAATYVVVTADNSEFKTEVTSTTVNVPAIASDAVTNLETNVEGNTATATWTAPSCNGGAEITGYAWEVYSDGEIVQNGTTTELTVTVKDLNPTTDYVIEVVAVNSAGESPIAYDNFTTGYIAPEGNVTTNTTSNSIEYNIAITQPGGNGNVTVKEVALLQGENVVATIVDGNLTGTFTELPYATAYTVRATVENAGGLTNTITADVSTKPIVTTAPLNPAATISGETSAKVTWDAPENNGGAEVTSYVVYYENANGTNTGNVTVNTTSADVTGLEKGQTYTFTVTAVNSAGESEASVATNGVTTAPATEITPLSEKAFLEILDSLGTFDVDVNLEAGIITANIPSVWNLPEGTWLGGVAYSDPTWLGWSYINSANQVSYDISNLPAGDHHLALYSADGTILGAAEFTIPAETTPGGNTDGGTTTTPGNTTTNNTAGENKDNSKVEATGTTYTPLLWAGGGFLIVAAGVYIIARRRQNADTKA